MIERESSSPEGQLFRSRQLVAQRSPLGHQLQLRQTERALRPSAVRCRGTQRAQGAVPRRRGEALADGDLRRMPQPVGPTAHLSTLGRSAQRFSRNRHGTEVQLCTLHLHKDFAASWLDLWTLTFWDNNCPLDPQVEVLEGSTATKTQGTFTNSCRTNPSRRHRKEVLPPRGPTSLTSLSTLGVQLGK